jgi:hypothetical protein
MKRKWIVFRLDLWKRRSQTKSYLPFFPSQWMIHPNTSSRKKQQHGYDCLWLQSLSIIHSWRNYTTITSILIYKQYNYTRTNSKYLKIKNCSVFFVLQHVRFVNLLAEKYQHDLITSAMLHVLTRWRIPFTALYEGTPHP